MGTATVNLHKSCHNTHMARAARVDVGGLVYHVINRANGRLKIFTEDFYYKDFEYLLNEARELYSTQILAYVLMPNHWHLLLHPRQDGDLSAFMGWLSTTHTRRYHSQTKTIGSGHLYQGRYKSFLVEDDVHLLSVLKYIERNPVRAKLTKTPEAWRWGSAYRRLRGNRKEKTMLGESPTPLPRNYQSWLHYAEPAEELEMIRKSVLRGTPYGGETWCDSMVRKFELDHTVRAPGRPAD